MTNGEKIRSMSDREIAESHMLTCRECVYDVFVDPTDPYACVRLGWDCVHGKMKWLEQEELHG